MRLASTLLALLFASNAYAGGVGLYTQGGFYQERLYYHRVDRNAPGGVLGPFKESQFLPVGGAGLEILLGDRDDRIQGLARMYWQVEGPQPDPSGSIPGQLSLQRRENLRHVGAFSVGLQGGLVGSPDKAMLTVIGLVGSGFMTEDHTEYVFGDFGVGGTVRASRSVEFYANALGHLRFRKWARGGMLGAAGVRFLFD
jgi:hypothetical protein